MTSWLLGLIGVAILKKVIEVSIDKVTDAGSTWASKHPLRASYWNHARLWGNKQHATFNARKCPQCDTV